jgi:lysozyme
MRALTLVLLVIALLVVTYVSAAETFTREDQRVGFFTNGDENSESLVKEKQTSQEYVEEEQMSDASLASGATLQAKTAVNIRAGPCTYYAIYGVLYTGQTVTFTGQVRSGCGYTWYSTNRGWIAAEFLSQVGGGNTGGGNTGGGGGSGATTINAAGLNMIKSFEGFRSCKYQDPAGYWTIGYGHLIEPGQHFTCITEAQATQLLLSDVSSAEQCVRTYVHVPLNGNQFSALVDFTYNLGCGSLASSTLLVDINSHNFGAVCGQLERWVYAGGRFLPGLVRRRQAECQLFNS